MQRSVWQWIDIEARKLLPFGLTFILVLYGVTPNYVPGFAQVTPMYALVCVYFWSLHRPDLFGYGSGFILGVADDLLTGAPIGSGVLALLLTQWLIFYQHKFFYAKSFIIIWLVFAVIAAGAILVKWVCVGIVSEFGFTRVEDLAGTCLITVTLYPLFSWLLAKAQLMVLTNE